MAKKRVHEIAKAQGLTSKEVLAALNAAGIEAKAAASNVEEADAVKAISAAKADGGATTATRTAGKAATAAKPKSTGRAKSTDKAKADGKAPSATPAKAGKRRRRVVIDSQASRRDDMRQAPPPRPPRRRGGRRRRPLLEEPVKGPAPVVEPEATTVPSGATVREVAELLDLGSAEVIKKLMTMGEMATLTQTLSDETVRAIADEYDRKIEIVTAADEEPDQPEFDDSAEDLSKKLLALAYPPIEGGPADVELGGERAHLDALAGEKAGPRELDRVFASGAPEGDRGLGPLRCTGCGHGTRLAHLRDTFRLEHHGLML